MTLISSSNLRALSLFPFHVRFFFPILDVLELDFVRPSCSSAGSNQQFWIRDEMHKFYARICATGDLGLRLLCHIIHFFVSIWYFFVGLMNTLESFLISSGLFKRYRDLDISKVKYLAVVIDSEEALQNLNVLQLLRWLAAIGLRNVCLYDKEGVLKISQEALKLWLKSERTSNETTGDPLFE
ncbi:uncharacterized protein LOC105163525 isoform X2 [Sesamum indicum]|uniref:ditrans,polycis-polyprenyl diphosphate synthase [(2E,6E)-farnesyldiphosphate specific] n=1 Tax=Sesamum indicum TaxID=4182 RepID=A0A8M8UUD0_SESIN|nr:uncharacterized protein LOC105163525 isoform X2 [Sesamum indicum]